MADTKPCITYAAVADPIVYDFYSLGCSETSTGNCFGCDSCNCNCDAGRVEPQRQDKLSQKFIASTQVIFRNVTEFEEHEVTTYEVGPWSNKQLKEFMNAIHKYQPQKTDCWCNFDVCFNDTHTLCIGTELTPIVVPKNLLCAEALEQYPATKLIIEMHPFIKPTGWKDTNDDGTGWCTCGVSSVHECPKCFMDGGCKHRVIGPFLGNFLCPGKYNSK